MDRVRAKLEAKEIMRGRLGSCILATLLTAIIGLIPVVGSPTGQLGSCHFYLDSADRKAPGAGRVGDGFNNLGKAFLLMLWEALWIFIWMLPGSVLYGIGSAIMTGSRGRGGVTVGIILFVVAGIYFVIIGIYKSLQYGFAFFALADNPGAGVREALDRSKAITRGHIGGLFVVELSFIGWHILAGFTFGLLYLFWLLPYINSTFGVLYRQLAGGPQRGYNAPPQYAGGQQQYNAAPQYAAPQQQQYNAAPRYAAPQQPAAPQPGLGGVNGMFAGYSFPLRAGETVTIGRDGAACQIVIANNADRVSRTHCSVSFDAQLGLYIVTDMSSNGTFLTDGTRLPPQRPNRVARGTIICLGDPSNSFKLI